MASQMVNRITLSSFGISLIIHGIILVLLAIFPFNQASPRFTEIEVVFDDPVPPEVIPVIEQVPEVTPPDTISMAQEEPVITEPVLSDPVVRQTPAAPPSVAPRARSTPQQAPPVGRPSDADILADVGDLMNRPQTQARPDASTPDLSRAIMDQAPPDSSEEANRFMTENQVAQSIDRTPPTVQSTAASNEPSSPSIQNQLAQQRQLMSSQFSQPNAPLTQSSTTGITDDRIEFLDGSSPRGLISANRLDLAKYLGQTRANINWPRSLTVEFEVNEAGFVRLLNDSEFSLYSDLALAVYRMFSDGQVFVAARGVIRQTGSITFTLR